MEDVSLTLQLLNLFCFYLVQNHSRSNAVASSWAQGQYGRYWLFSFTLKAHSSLHNFTLRKSVILALTLSPSYFSSLWLSKHISPSHISQLPKPSFYQINVSASTIQVHHPLVCPKNRNRFGGWIFCIVFFSPSHGICLTTFCFWALLTKFLQIITILATSIRLTFPANTSNSPFKLEHLRPFLPTDLPQRRIQTFNSLTIETTILTEPTQQRTQILKQIHIGTMGLNVHSQNVDHVTCKETNVTTFVRLLLFFQNRPVPDQWIIQLHERESESKIHLV